MEHAANILFIVPYYGLATRLVTLGMTSFMSVWENNFAGCDQFYEWITLLGVSNLMSG